MGAPELFDRNVATGAPVGTLGGTPGTIPVWSTGTTLGNSIVTQTAQGVVVTGFTNGLLPISGSTPTNASFLVRGPLTNALFMGASNASPFGTWLQSTDAAVLGNWYPLLLNPNGGNVGIGTASPGAKLNVNGTGIALAGTGLANSIHQQDQTNYRGIALGYDTSGQIGLVCSTGSTSALAFWTHNGTAFGERARIDSAGNFGIGTASPAERLHLYATSGNTIVRAENTSSTGTARYQIRNDVGQSQLAVYGSAAAGSIFGTAVASGTFLFTDGAAGGVLGLGTQTAQPIIFGTNTSERMRINSTGAAADSQVAIGTSSFATFTGGGVASLTTNRDVSVNGVRVGMGRGAVASNTAVGAGALDAGTSGQSNTAVGVSAAAAISTSSFQTAVGARAAQVNTAASSTMVGADCASAATSASEITAVGSFCLGTTVTASRASAVGCLALYSITGSNDTCALGHSAGRYAGAGTTANTSATDSIFIGSDSRAGASGNSNEIVIGKGAIGNGSNTVTIGNSSNVGIFLDTRYVRLVDSYTVGTLPVAGTAGRIARVTDGDAALAWGATVVNTGAGATPYLVWDNGTNWTVFGK